MTKGPANQTILANLLLALTHGHMTSLDSAITNLFDRF